VLLLLLPPLLLPLLLPCACISFFRLVLGAVWGE
jgi:hypothetical protein